ncbi:MAG: hypothetical protein WD042_18160 [Phycisphaeraceae bacterium]
MINRAITFACFVMAIGVTTISSQASNRLVEQGAFLKAYCQGAWLYHHEHQSWPISNATGTWYGKLTQARMLPPYLAFGVSAVGEPLDLYGHPVILEPPGPAHPGVVVVRAVGQNGIDDHGALDDWEVRLDLATSQISGEPQLGYWYKKRWPAAYRRAVICAMLAVVGVALVWWRFRSRALRWVLSLLGFGILGTVVLPWGFDRAWGGSSASVDPQWLYVVDVVAQFALLAGMIVGGLCVWSAARDWLYRRAHPFGFCLHCRYDLRGTIWADRDRCPECGERIDSVTWIRVQEKRRADSEERNR